MAVDLCWNLEKFDGEGGFIVVQNRTLMSIRHTDFQTVAAEPIYVMILGS